MLPGILALELGSKTGEDILVTRALATWNPFAHSYFSKRPWMPLTPTITGMLLHHNRPLRIPGNQVIGSTKGRTHCLLPSIVMPLPYPSAYPSPYLITYEQAYKVGKVVNE